MRRARRRPNTRPAARATAAAIPPMAAQGGAGPLVLLVPDACAGGSLPGVRPPPNEGGMWAPMRERVPLHRLAERSTPGTGGPRTPGAWVNTSAGPVNGSSRPHEPPSRGLATRTVRPSVPLKTRLTVKVQIEAALPGRIGSAPTSSWPVTSPLRRWRSPRGGARRSLGHSCRPRRVVLWPAAGRGRSTPVMAEM